MTDRDWMNRAACAGHPNPDLFFPTTTGSGAQKQVDEAARICATCPVIAECDEYRKSTGSVFGIWGGDIVRSYYYGSTAPRPTYGHGTEAMYMRHLREPQKYGRPCHSCRVAARQARALREQKQVTA